MNRFELERGDSLEENKGHQKIIDEVTGDFR